MTHARHTIQQSEYGSEINEIHNTNVIQTLLSALHRPAFVMALDGRIVTANSASASRVFLVSLSKDQSPANVFDQFPCLQNVLTTPEQLTKLKQGLSLEHICTFRIDNTTLHSLTLYPIFNEHNVLSYLAVAENEHAEAHQLSEELRRERQRFLYLLETLPGFIYFISPDSTISYTNKTFRKIFGNPTSKQFLHFLHSSGPNCGLNIAVDSLQSERIIEWELSYKNRSYHIYSYPMTDIDGAVVAVVFGIDVTARCQAEQAVRQSEANYQAIVNKAPIGIFQITLDGTFLTVNPALASTLGYDSPTEFMAHSPSFHQLFYYPLQSRFLLKELEQRDGVNDYQSPFNHKNGSTTWMSIYIRKTQDETNDSTFYEGFAIDISLSKQALADLAHSERQLKAIVENAREAIVIISDRKVVFANPFLEEMTGYRAAEFIETDFLDYIHPEDQATLHERYIKRIQGEHAAQGYDFRILKKDKVPLWVQVTAAPFEWAGKPATLNFLSDITDRKEAEYALKKVLEDQENLILARTRTLRETNTKLEGEMKHRQMVEQSLLDANANLTQEIEKHKQTARKLEAAKRRADQAVKAKSAFLANMSHEIRTPLNVILGMTEVALHRPPKEGDVRHLEMIKEAGDSLLLVINDILDFSKIEADKLTLENTSFDLYILLAMLRDSFADQAGTRGLQLHLNITKNTPRYVKGDPARLRQILFNLLSNALKFTQHGSITISVRPNATTHRGLSALSTLPVLFKVSDTGVGIKHEQLETIFESFQQADTSIARRFGGTGLGLSISSRLVERMGGRIWVESEFGKGSSFFFTVHFAPSSPKELTLLQDEQRRNTTYTVRPLNILLVEDSALGAELVKAMLAPQGHTITHASSGQSALEILAQNTFDIILMDIQLPEMDGIEVTGRIRSNTTLAVSQSIPIIAMTAHAMPEDKRALLASGFSDYIAKPITIEDLLACLKKASLEILAPNTTSDPPSPQQTPTDALTAFVDKSTTQSTAVEDHEGRIQALARLGGNKALLQELQAVFVRVTPQDVEKLQEVLHIKTKNAADIAHTIKGNASSIGETRIAESARLLEQALQNKNSQEIERCFDELDANIKNSIMKLSRIAPSSPRTV